MAVGIGVHQQEDLAVAQLGDIERVTHSTAERADDVLQLLVLEQLLPARLLGVEHLALERKNRLRLAIAALLSGPACGFALDDEQLALVRIRRGAIGELAWQVEPVADRRLARDLLRRRTRCLARTRRDDHPRDDRS